MDPDVDKVDMGGVSQLLQPEEAMTGVLWDCSRGSELGACLVPLLVALGYRGDWRHVAEALPFGGEPLDLAGLRRTLSRLSFRSHLEACDLSTIDPRRLPCLFLPDEQKADKTHPSHSHSVMVALGDQSGSVLVFDAEKGQLRRPGSAISDEEDGTLATEAP